MHSVLPSALAGAGKYSSFEDEIPGHWEYVVVSPTAVKEKTKHSFRPRAKTVLAEGTLLVAGCRKEAKDGSTWVRVGGEKWVAEKDLKEVRIERGSWQYRVVFPQGVCRRVRPTMEKALAPPGGAASILREGALFTVSERLPLDDVVYLKIDDPSTPGWVFDHRAGDPGNRVCELVSGSRADITGTSPRGLLNDQSSKNDTSLYMDIPLY
ncbi:unnamed protein product [Amoebophrya sp. A120]|nr:unnamed protein product [Amoebophrya sp. A120]|eukprot:GSA120T00017405001.1